MALAETRVVESDKVKAASVIIHVLTWANFAEPKWNPKPDFTMDDIKRLIHLPADELEKERERITAAMQCLHEPKTDPLAGIDFDDKKQVADALMKQSARIMNDKPKNPTNMEEKKQRGRAPMPVAQLHPETLEVIKVWPSRCEAERQTGACNIDRCIAKHRMSAGYYWCMPEEADTFKPNPLSGHQPTEKKKAKDAGTASDIVAKIEKFKEDMKRLTPDAVPAPVAAAAPLAKFKVGDHVRSKQQKELYGRTGYIKAVDTYKMNYTVTFGAEAWIIPEYDLELVNEPVMSEYITKRGTEGLADYTDDELLEELDRRGWEGELSRRQVVTIGVKQ